MPIATVRQFYNTHVELGLNQIVKAEALKVVGLNGTVDQLNQPPIPQRGDLHPLGGTGQVYEGARVEKVNLLARINPTTCIVIVLYRRQVTGYSGGPRSAVSAYGIEEDQELPVWVRYTAGSAQWWERPAMPVVRKRVTMVRDEVRFLGGNAATVTAVQKAIAINAGALYTIDGDLYQLSGRSSVVWDGISQVRINYRFFTRGPFPAVPANNPEVGNHVAIPALPAHGVWRTNRDPANAGNVPIISVVPITTLSVVGTVLPGL